MQRRVVFRQTTLYWSCGIAVLDLVGIYGMCTISCCFVERLGTSEKGVPVEVQRWGVRCFKL
jgi:hypothetical protein